MTLSPTIMLAILLWLNCEYLLTKLYGCEDDPVTYHHIGHDIRVELCIPADPH